MQWSKQPPLALPRRCSPARNGENYRMMQRFALVVTAGLLAFIVVLLAALVAYVVVTGL